MGPMNPGDRELGMDRPITRRDFLHGMSAVVAGGLAARRASGEPAPRGEPRRSALGSYPPALSGLRGSQPGSFEVAHQLAREGRSDWEPVDEPDGAIYDLVVVGGGVSGLAAAYFFRRRNPGARILILENHDDFGGHARRNEFRSGGRTVIGYGGSQSLEEPSSYSSIAKRLLRELGVETSRFHTASSPTASIGWSPSMSPPPTRTRFPSRQLRSRKGKPCSRCRSPRRRSAS
jgi:spermidine dehydrogenase